MSEPNSSPKVAAVVVAYKAPQMTLRCVRSLAALAYPNLEIIVVENDSGDETRDVLRRKLAGARLVCAAENGGYTAGNNLGISEALARGAEYVLVVNPDALALQPYFLGELVGRLEQHPCIGAVGPRVHLRERGIVQNTILRFPWLWRRSIDWVLYRLGVRRRQPSTPVAADALNGVCVLFRSACLRDVGLFDERTFAYIEDVEWAYRAQAGGWTCEFVPTDGVLHLQGSVGYERGGRVDFLLKRNTLYFLMKTEKQIQAAGYTAATLGIGFWLAAREAIRADGRKHRRWIKELLRTYWGLWTHRWDSVMGRPKW
jgi:GT2 family glycosyltransferase